jgi:hypothetical protein
MAEEDARFSDADPVRDAPLRLQALDAGDLRVIAALVQDAVLPLSEMRHDRAGRRLAMLVNRFRWEAQTQAPERVQAVLVVEEALAVRVQGVPQDRDLVASLLDIAFEPGEDGTGTVLLTLAGDGAIAVDVEALGVRLRDVTRPYAAPSRRTPSHPD